MQNLMNGKLRGGA